MCFQRKFQQFKAIFFDCDGTLVDSENAHYLSWKQALINLGGDLAPDEYHHYVGQSAEKNAALMAEKIGKDCAEIILKMKREVYGELCKVRLPPIHPTVNFLKMVAEEKQRLDIKIGVCSAAKKEGILSHLRHLNIEQLIDIVLSGEEDLDEYSDPEGVNKPKPYIYLHAIKKLGLTSKECIVIEDSAPGVAAGLAAGCFTIAIPNDWTRLQDHSSANLRIESLSNINLDGFFHMVNEAQFLAIAKN